LAGCGQPDTKTYQGYVEGEFVYVASSMGGRLEHLGVQRGQTVGAGAPLFVLESTDEAAARQQAAAQLQAAEAQLADLNLGRRVPEVDVARAQLAQAVAADKLSSIQLTRDEAQFRAGGIPQAQLDASRSTAQTNAQRWRRRNGGWTRRRRRPRRAVWWSTRCIAKASGWARAAPWCACCRRPT
jgi:HlyD family secretion protein